MTSEQARHIIVIGAAIVGAIRSELGDAEAIVPELACIGLRPVPLDGAPVIGHLPQAGSAYACARHPGIVPAAIVGRPAGKSSTASRRQPCRRAAGAFSGVLIPRAQAPRIRAR